METHCICEIRKIYRAIGAFEAELEKLLGLNMNEAMLLCLLSEKKNLSAGDISTELGLTCSNASKVIASMEKSGLILRRASKADGRSMTFSLSKKGTALLDKVHCDNIHVPDDLQKLISKDFKPLNQPSSL